MQFKLPRWLKDRRPRNPSVLVLADTQLHNWPKDGLCHVIVKDWPVKRWAQAIKLGEIWINCSIIVLYLEGTQTWRDVLPLKNALQALCRVIKHHSSDPRIFISNHLPRVSGSPMQPLVTHTNFTLQQATRSICRVLGWVFELSIYEHFVTSKHSRILRPTQVYFEGARGLTRLGCMVFHECLLREVGLKSYWFTEREPEQVGAVTRGTNK